MKHMKLNNLVVTRYNTGFRVEITVFAEVEWQFTTPMLTGEGHHQSLWRASLAAWRHLLAQCRNPENIPA